MSRQDASLQNPPVPLYAARCPMSTLDAVWSAVARELALPDVDTLTTIIVRVLVAAVLGGIVGWEREHKGRAAGLKTHILVSIGSALFVLAPLMSGIDGAEVTRVMQGIVSGIGFLGAGAILKLGKDERIEGLTTAAGVWMTAAIGMAAGMGEEMVALVTTLVAMLVVKTVPRLQRRESRDVHDLQVGKHADTKGTEPRD